MTSDDAGARAWDALVVGGGVAGLVAARDLARAGRHTLVLEAGPRVGGAVAGHVVAGLTLDAGAESFATRGGAVSALLTELGRGTGLVEPSGLGSWVQLPGGPTTLPRTGVLGIPADPWAPDVRRTLGTVGAARASVDRVLPRTWGTGGRPGSAGGSGPTSLARLVRTRLGGRVLKRLVTPVVAGVHAARPADVDADAVAPGLLDALARTGSLTAAVRSLRGSAGTDGAAAPGSAVAGLAGGVHGIVEALLHDLGSHGATVRTGAQVTGLRRADRDGPDPGWSVSLADGTAVAAAVVVVATPAAAAVRLLATAVPGLDDLHPDAGADVVLATLVVDAPALDGAPRGTGVLVAPGVDVVRAKALTHATAKWPWLRAAAGPGRHVLRLSYGVAPGTGVATGVGAAAGTGAAASSGDVDPRDLSADALTDLALRDASTLLGVPLGRDQLVDAARVRWSQALPTPSAEHRATVSRVTAAIADVPDLAVVGAWVAGNGLAQVVPRARAAVVGLLRNPSQNAT